VVGDTVHLAYCLQDAARPLVHRRQGGACSGLRPQTGAVEELLPLMVMGRAAPLAAVVVRPGSADAVVCMS
jgi:class 3 adenylate cyclase